MSQVDNPYAVKAAPPSSPPGAGPPARMDYFGSYGAVFQNPSWVPNIFFAAIVNLIPVIGPIVMLGYQFEIVESQIRDPRRGYPNFDWNRFIEYLTRGAWPFLMSLIVGAVAAPIAMIAWFGTMIMAAALAGGGGDAGAAIGLMMFFAGFVMFFLLLVGMQFVVTAFQIRAGLTQDFAASFNFTWVRDFISRVWVEMILAMLFVAVTAIVLVVLGALVLCVGMYLAIAVVMMAQAQIYYQLYCLYLSRGGEPIPLKPAPAAGIMPG